MFLPMGGASNAKYFIDELKPIITGDKKIIVIFDRDGAGSDGIKSCINVGNNRGCDFGVYGKNSWYYFMLPKTTEHTEIDFLIEDYFPKTLKRHIAQTKIDEADGHFNKYPKDLKEQIKGEIKAQLQKTDAMSFQGFKILLDRIVGIINNTEQITPF